MVEIDHKMCLFAIKIFVDQGIRVDRAELLSLSKFSIGYARHLHFYCNMVPVCLYNLLCWVFSFLVSVAQYAVYLHFCLL